MGFVVLNTNEFKKHFNLLR